MKTTSSVSKNIARKTSTQTDVHNQRLTMSGLEQLCDDPARDESGQEVQAVLTPRDSGLVLSARDGAVIYRIVDEQGKQMTFNSIERALNILSDVPHLLSEVAIDIRCWRLVH